jgi:hypothetical protein
MLLILTLGVVAVWILTALAAVVFAISEMLSHKVPAKETRISIMPDIPYVPYLCPSRDKMVRVKERGISTNLHLN